MQTYKRKITYFYEHHKDNVGATAGFLKLEIRGDKVKIIINIQEPLGLPYQGAGLYFYHEAGDNLVAVKVGEVERINGMLTYQDRTDWQNMYGTGRDLYTFDGVAVVYNDSHYYIGDFMDKSRADYPLLLKKEEAAGTRNEQSDMEGMGKAEESNPQTQSKVTTNQMYRPGTHRTQAENMDLGISDIFAPNRENVETKMSEDTSAFTQKLAKNIGETQLNRGNETRIEQAAKVSEEWYENIPSPEENQLLAEQKKPINENEETAFRAEIKRQNVGDAGAERQNVEDSGTERQNLEETEKRRESTVYDRCKNCPYQKRRREQQEGRTSFEKMLAEYPKLPMYGATELFDCVRIHPRDIGKLDMRNWKLGVNSFLTHGFYTYQYLLLGKMRFDNGKERPIIGVPGVFSNRDKYLANMFGFEQFVPVKKTGTKTGEFGYWIVEIE